MGMNISIAFIDRTFLLRALYYIAYCAESSGLSDLYTTELVDRVVPDSNDRQCKKSYLRILY